MSASDDDKPDRPDSRIDRSTDRHRKIATDGTMHEVNMRALPDIRGLVFFATCSCGWRGANHPSVMGSAEASQRATADVHEHLASIQSDELATN